MKRPWRGSFKSHRDQVIGPRILHDVDCVAGVLILRGDRANPQALEDARAVFATSTVIVVKNVSDWYIENGGQGIAPAVHHLNLTNLAWLKKPAAAQDLKLHELVALCEAALRPSRETWNHFLKHLRRLEEEGRVTSDESVAILASELTDRLLATLEDEDTVEPESITEIVERVKESYRKEADQKVATAEGYAARLSESHRQMVTKLTARADRVAASITYLLFTIACVLVGYPLLISIPGLLPNAQLRGLSRWAGIVLFVVTFMGLVAGQHLQQWRSALESKLRPHVRRLIMGGTWEVPARVPMANSENRTS